MEKNRQTKVIAIVALLVAIVGMSLGFAAFSNILTISSSATVTPNSKDFKLVAYGLGEELDGDTITGPGDLINVSKYTSTTSGMPILGGKWNDTGVPLDSEVATIVTAGDEISISNISVEFSNPYDWIMYPFLIKNEGAYDAYITGFEEIGTKTCTAGEGTTPALVETACENFEVTLTGLTIKGEDLEEVDFKTNSVKIAPGENLFIGYDIYYFGPTMDIRADGPFEVDFPDIKITFGTAA